MLTKKENVAFLYLLLIKLKEMIRGKTEVSIYYFNY